jgi:catechol 2,3-dioxygenase-like lactoylglutathione lyase family enzyme
MADALDSSHRVPDQPALGQAVLDHVAVALPEWRLGWPRYVRQLGGIWTSGAQTVGFAPSQLRFGNGARLELLAPHQPEANPFLARFLERSGPGIHHVTFKVPSLDDALQRISAAGLDVVDVDRSDPDWQEAFLRPSQAQGIVVQLAQATGSWESPPPPEFPEPGRPAASFLGLVHAVADLPAALELFSGLLDGTPVAKLQGPGWQAVELAWAGPLRIRLLAPEPESASPSPAAAQASLGAWLGGRPGRAHHLRFALAPEAPSLALPEARHVLVPGETLPADALLWVPGEANLGVQLVLVPAGDPPEGTREQSQEGPA